MTLKDDFKQDDKVLKHTGWDHLYVAKPEEAKVRFRTNLPHVTRGQDLVRDGPYIICIYLNLALSNYHFSMPSLASNLRSLVWLSMRATASRANLVS